MSVRRFKPIVFLSSLVVLLALGKTSLAQTIIVTNSQKSEDSEVSPLQKQIQGYYDEMDRAMERLDVNQAVRYLPLDYIAFDKKNNKINLPRLKDQLRILFRRAIKIESHTRIAVFTSSKDTVTIENETHMTANVIRDDGMKLYMEANSQTRDFWIKRQGKWLMKQSRVEDQTMRINGQLALE